MIRSLVCAGVLMASAAVAAASPPLCTSGTGARAREVGRRQGGSMVASAWASAGRDCGQLARVEQAVRDALARRAIPPDSGEALVCREDGFQAGADEALARIAAACAAK